MKKLLEQLKEHDLDTYYHSLRVADLSLRLAENLSWSEKDKLTIYYSGLLHDIGKLKIDKEILNKPAKLTDEEWILIQQHPIFGYQVLNHYQKINNEIRYVVLFHHERINGSGYPFKLRGEKIPLKAQLVAIADSFDAMTKDRAYSHAKTVNKALDQLILNKGILFDPLIVDTLVEHINSSKKIKPFNKPLVSLSR